MLFLLRLCRRIEASFEPLRHDYRLGGFYVHL
jgi:hypothetical protein